MRLRIILGVLPVAVFYTLTRVAPVWLAVAGGFTVSIAVFRLAKRSGVIRVLAAFSMTVATFTAILAIVWESEKAYLAGGPISDFLLPLLHIGSLFLGRPLAGAVAHEVIPGLATRVPVNHRLFASLTAAWAVFHIMHGLVLVWLLRNLSVGEYILASRAAGWPLTGSMLLVSILLIAREARALSGRTSPAPVIAR